MGIMTGTVFPRPGVSPLGKAGGVRFTTGDVFPRSSIHDDPTREGAMPRRDDIRKI